MTIQRYNQGFGGFGPLEKCKEGKLVKYADHDAMIDKIKEKRDVLWHKFCRINELCLDKDDEILNLTIKLKKSDNLFVIQTVNVIGCAILLLAILYLK